ncbi:Superoxide dismutase, copper/zinc binding domain [Phytophthora cactorum]|nr:Superoxide dismutase, copper/zinc binding domain [Phytophthora cactorum]
MLSSKILAVFALATLAAADDYTTDDYDEGSSYVDEGSSFDYSALPAYTYTGTINVQYGGPFSTFAVISTDLDFSDVDQSEIMVTEYKWHIHVKWPHDYDSESFQQCGLAITGNHYDPLKACGPNSEFVGTEECLLKTPEYACNPDEYAQDPLVCEKGDLSGKFGDFKLDDSKKESSEYFDLNYPLPEEKRPSGASFSTLCAARSRLTSGWSSLSGSYYK